MHTYFSKVAEIYFPWRKVFVCLFVLRVPQFGLVNFLPLASPSLSTVRDIFQHLLARASTKTYKANFCICFLSAAHAASHTWREELSTLFYMQELTDTCDWLVGDRIYPTYPAYLRGPFCLNSKDCKARDQCVIGSYCRCLHAKSCDHHGGEHWCFSSSNTVPWTKSPWNLCLPREKKEERS